MPSWAKWCLGRASVGTGDPGQVLADNHKHKVLKPIKWMIQQRSIIREGNQSSKHHKANPKCALREK